MNKMKERFEILLEEIRGDVKLALEGHDTLRSEMRQMEERLSNKIGAGDQALDAKIDSVYLSLKNEIRVTGLAITDKIDEHIKQPAHA